MQEYSADFERFAHDQGDRGRSEDPDFSVDYRGKWINDLVHITASYYQPRKIVFPDCPERFSWARKTKSAP